MTLNDGALQRARLVPEEDASHGLDCHYNPSSLTLATGARWTTPKAKNHKAPPQFVGSEPQTWTMELLFDSSEGQPKQSVVEAVATLISWTCATESSRTGRTPRPTLLRMHWGREVYGPGYLKSVSAQYILFDADGEPLRAKVSVVLAEVSTEPKGTNPTSGGVAGRRTAVLDAGDTLASVAYREYGDPALWRALAAANDIDDPARLPAGTRLLVPPQGTAHQLSGGVGA